MNLIKKWVLSGVNERKILGIFLIVLFIFLLFIMLLIDKSIYQYCSFFILLMLVTVVVERI